MFFWPGEEGSAKQERLSERLEETEKRLPADRGSAEAAGVGKEQRGRWIVF